MLPPARAAREGMADWFGDGAHEAVALHDDAILLLQEDAVAVIFQDPFFEGGKQPALHTNAEIVDAKVHAKEINGVARVVSEEDMFRQPLLMPDGDCLLPKAEVSDRGTVARLVVHGGKKPFTC